MIDDEKVEMKNSIRTLTFPQSVSKLPVSAPKFVKKVFAAKCKSEAQTGPKKKTGNRQVF